MEAHFLDFLELAPRSAKPRSRGLTIVRDPGYPSSWLRELLDVYAEYIDMAKFPITFLPFPASHVEQNIRLYRDYNVDVAVDDPMFQVAYLQRKVEPFFAALYEAGVTNVQIDIPKGQPNRREEEERCLALARDVGLQVDGEVGQKYSEGDIVRAEGGLINVEATVAEARRLLALGCQRVYLENAVIREAIGDKSRRSVGTEQLHQVVEAIGLDQIIIEINGSIMSFDAAQHSRFWAVKNFGPDVNMGGGEALIDVLFIEAMRRGISFVHGETKNPRLWVNSLARHDGRAHPEWWKEADAE